MNILIVLAHPEPGSLNHAIADAVRFRANANGHKVIFHDLYAEAFNPVLPGHEIPRYGDVADEIRRHCDELTSADGIVIVHPNWWGQPPAVLKGWIDRVIRPGVAYEFADGDDGEGVPIGLLKAETAIIFNTSNTDPRRERIAFGDPLQLLWKNCIFDLCGVSKFDRRMYSTVVTSTVGQREGWLAEVDSITGLHFPHRQSM